MGCLHWQAVTGTSGTLEEENWTRYQERYLEKASFGLSLLKDTEAHTDRVQRPDL